MTRVLLIDDDLEFTGLLCEYLTDEGFDVLATDDGAKGLAFVDSGATDIIVLDVMMPIMNGVDVLQNIRKSSEIPIVMLTARGMTRTGLPGWILVPTITSPSPVHPANWWRGCGQYCVGRAKRHPNIRLNRSKAANLFFIQQAGRRISMVRLSP